MKWLIFLHENTMYYEAEKVEVRDNYVVCKNAREIFSNFEGARYRTIIVPMARIEYIVSEEVRK